MSRLLAGLKWLPFGLVCAVVGVKAPVVVTDWSVAKSAGGQLLSSAGLTVYTDHPQAQMGPLALAVAGALPKPVYVTVVSLLLVLFLRLCEVSVRSTTNKRDVHTCLAIGGAILIYPWSDFASQGHADDVLVLVGCALLLRAVTLRSPRLAVAALALAMAAKPTAVLMTPVLLLFGSSTIIVGLFVSLAIWAPFFMADPVGFMRAGRGVTEVRPGSFPDFLGYELWGPTPAWIRLLALGGGVLLCLFLVRRGEIARGLVLAFSWRAAVDPNPAQCYASSVIAIGLLVDVGSRRVPLTAGVGSLGWLVSEPVMRAPVLGWPRILITLATAATAPREARLARSSDTRLEHGHSIAADASRSGEEEPSSSWR
jgi:hypothetical protein